MRTIDDEKMSIIKKILDLNPEACLTGTAMLLLRGIDIGRDANDIDILVGDYAPNLRLPDDMIVEVVESASDGCGIKYVYKGNIVIDIMSSHEEPQMVDGIRCGTLESLIKAKERYSRQNNPAAQKHESDLKMINEALQKR